MDTATTEIYTLSLHDALPLSYAKTTAWARSRSASFISTRLTRSEEHTSELQSHVNIVCRLLLEKKKMVRCSRASHRSASVTFVPPPYGINEAPCFLAASTRLTTCASLSG